MGGTKQNKLASAGTTVKFTLVTKGSGPLTKIIYCQDGKLKKDMSKCWLNGGTAQEVEVSFQCFAKDLRKLRHNQAIVHGICGHKEIKIVSERNFKGQPGTVTRTKKFFRYSKKNALCLFDYDVKPGMNPLSHDTWLKTMSGVIPGFGQAGHVITPSTSACIYDKDGHQLTGEGYGFHHYCIVLDPADIPRFNDVLFRRLWLAGRGYIFISRSGVQLERTIYDQFVMSPERLDFVAGAVCRDGLEQRLPDPVYRAGDVLDTRLLPSLTQQEESEFKHLTEQVKQDTRDEANTVRAEYLKTEAPRLAKRLNVSQNEARKILSTRVCGKLDAEDFLEFDNGEPARAGDILKDPARYHLKTLRDPLEPEQGKCKAKLFLNDDGSVIVNSYLHGGRTWRLQEDSKAQLELLLEETRRDPGAPYRPENLDMLAAMKNRDFPSFIALREKLRSLKVRVTQLDRAINAKAGDNSEITANNHLQIARKVASFYGRKNILSTEAFIWKWDERGVWRKIDDREIKHEIHKVINSGRISKGIVESILDLLKTEIFIPGHSFDINTTAINCLNGELHWNGQTWDLQPHKRENYRTAQIPVAYDPEARAPRFERFLEEVFSGDADKDKKIYLVCEALGYSLLYSTKYEKFFILVGPGANGKSVLMNTLSCLVGPEYVAAVQPCQFGNRFQRAHLHCKLVNLVTEIAEGHVIEDAQLKAIVSGELTTAEHKHKPPFNFTPYATCWFGTNHMPHTRDFSNALFRRAIILPFSRTFEEHEQDRCLGKKLKKELPGILNLALEAVAGVFQRGAFTQTTSCDQAKKKWRLECDQVAQFLQDRGTLKPECKTPVSKAYRSYQEWAHDVGVKQTLGRRKFTERMERLGIESNQSTGGYFYLFGVNINESGRK